MNFEFLKRTTPTVFHQRFELGTLGSESECSSTELRCDLYVKGGDNVFNAKGRANEIGQSWCPVDLLEFQLPVRGHLQTLCTHVAIDPYWQMVYCGLVTSIEPLKGTLIF